MPYPPAQCRKGGALHVLVCIAYPQLRQSWPSFRPPSPRAPAWRGEKGSPGFHSRIVQLLLHLVRGPRLAAWGSTGPGQNSIPYAPVLRFAPPVPGQRSYCPAASAACPAGVACPLQQQLWPLERRLACRWERPSRMGLKVQSQLPEGHVTTPCRTPSSRGSHISSVSHRNRAGWKCAPHFQSRGRGPKGGTCVEYALGFENCN